MATAVASPALWQTRASPSPSAVAAAAGSTARLRPAWTRTSRSCIPKETTGRKGRHRSCGLRLECSRSAVVEKEVDAAAAAPVSPRRGLHPSGKEVGGGRLPVSDGHEIFYKVYGNPEASRVALFVHGGPGAGCWPNHARFFNQDKWKVVLVDQRGCGASRPKGRLTGNTTQALVADYEALRAELNIDKWMLLGGSWGVALSLAYAQAHPDRVTGLILRGICLMRDCEIDWMFRGGVAAVYPEAWRRFRDHLSETEQCDPLLAYYRRLTSEDATTRSSAASVWGSYESAVSRAPTAAEVRWNGREWVGVAAEEAGSVSRQHASSRSANGSDAPAVVYPATGEVSGPVNAQALLECHYSVNGAFLRGEGALLRHVDKIRHLPCVMVQGQLDFVCPMRTALDLKASWPEAELRLVPGAGHSMYEPAITHELVTAVEQMEALY